MPKRETMTQIRTRAAIFAPQSAATGQKTTSEWKGAMMRARPALLIASAALALGVTAQTATTQSTETSTAIEHTILILGDAYFPDITHVDPGDVVYFVNTTSVSQDVVAANDAWEVGPIPAAGELSMVIEENQELTYYNKGSFSEDADAYTVGGYFSFEDAPID